MENIEKVLNLVSQYVNNPGTFDGHTHLGSVYPAARKEFEALKAAGVGVKIEQVERVIVVKPTSRRGGRRKKTETKS